VDRGAIGGDKVKSHLGCTVAGRSNESAGFYAVTLDLQARILQDGLNCAFIRFSFKNDLDLASTFRKNPLLIGRPMMKTTMEIHILLEGEQLGPFSEIQVRKYLGEGLVSPSDLATYEGMEDWQSLDHILTNLANLPAPEAPASAVAVIEAPVTEIIAPNVPLTPPDTQGPVDPDVEPSPASMRKEPPPTFELESVSEQAVTTVAIPKRDEPPVASPAPESSVGLSSTVAPEDAPPATASVDSPEPAPQPAPNAAEFVLPLTASQKTKRKLNKIVIQPIQPLEATAPAPATTKKKLKTGKTALALEALRPTTALPPVSGFAPKPKTPAKGPTRTGPVSLRMPAASPIAPSPQPKSSPPPPPVPDAIPAAAPTVPIVPEVPKAKVPAPLPEIRLESLGSDAWYRLIPKRLVLAGLALILIAIGLFVGALYLISYFRHAPASTVSADSQTITSPATPIEIPSSEPTAGTAAEFRERGTALQSQGDLDGAIQNYNQALGLDSKDAVSYYQRGLALQAKGNLDAALNDFTQSIAVDPTQANAFSNRAFIKQSRGDLDGALADYGQALVLNPKIAVAYYNEGLIKVQKGNLDGAISMYDRALDLDPQMAIAYYNRGVAKNAEGNVDGAIADYTQALALNPKIPRAYCDRGLARQAKGDLDGTLADYASALALNPNMAAVLYNRGLVEMEKGDLNSALSDYTQSIDLSPKNELAYYNRGLALFGKGNLDGALADLTKYCAMAPREPEVDTARLYIWLISTKQNPKGTADQDLAKALQNDWNSPPEEFSSKIAGFLLGHLRENDLIANAASPDPAREPAQYCEAWYFAGMKKLLAGKQATAISYFQKCVATRQTQKCEHLFAQIELQALNQDR
jgi:lipoprotein NlpI